MRRIKWGVLGTANIARVCTIPGMCLAKNCELYAIAGRSREKAERYRAEFGFEKAYDSYEALLADPLVEAVYIPLPNSLHHEWVIRAACAGKHILCEKPMAPSAEKAVEMQAAARENGVLLMEAYAYLHTPLIAAIKSELEQETIGEVRFSESAFITADYDLSNIRMRRETLGGSLYDLGCYCISQAVWLFGEPEDVRAVAEYTAQGIDRLTAGWLLYPNGTRAAFSCGMLLPTDLGMRVDRLHIYGTKGELHSDAKFNQDGRLGYQLVYGDKVINRHIEVPQNCSLEIENLGQCILTGKQPRVSAEFSLATARTMDKVLAAIRY